MNIDKSIMKNKNTMTACNLMKLTIKDGLVATFHNISIYITHTDDAVWSKFFSSFVRNRQPIL